MKNISKFVMLILLVSSFYGCKKASVKDGTEAAKILLANERLDGEDLRTNGNLFSSGKAAFNRIKEETRKYSKKLEESGAKQKFEIEGNTYRWSEIGDYSNFISFFDSYASSIEQAAERGAELIDDAKMNVRVINKWVKDGSIETLLTVDKSKETIYSRNSSRDQYEICRRYQDEEGLNVFELYRDSDNGEVRTRMKYIPGMRYEFILKNRGMNIYLIAHKDKGYWDIMCTDLYDLSNVDLQNMVMKDEAIYLTNYMISHKQEYFGDVQLVSFDGESDLFKLNDYGIEIYTSGLTGLKCFEIDANDNEVFDLTKNNNQYPDNSEDYKVYSVGEGDSIQYFTNHEDTYAVFNNGKKFKAGDKLCDNKIEVRNVNIFPVGGIDFYGSFVLNLSSDFYLEESKLDIYDYLSKIANEYGFSFKGNYNDIIDAARYAQKDAVNFSKYYRWHGYNINNIDNFPSIEAKENELLDGFVNEYNKVKDNDKVNKFNQEEMSAAYYFSDVALMNASSSSATLEKNNLKSNDITVKSLDTALFVQGKEYVLEIGAIKEDGDIYPLENKNKVVKKYEGGVTFEISQSIDVSIPLLEEGNYTLVAYFATYDEGIRVTKTVNLIGAVDEYVYSENGLENKIYSYLKNIQISATKDYTINVNLSGNYTYDTLYDTLTKYAYDNGEIIDTYIEKFDGYNWIRIDENDAIEKGQYRIMYRTNNNISYVVATIV